MPGRLAAGADNPARQARAHYLSHVGSPPGVLVVTSIASPSELPAARLANARGGGLRFGLADRMPGTWRRSVHRLAVRAGQMRRMGLEAMSAGGRFGRPAAPQVAAPGVNAILGGSSAA
jgi:hypothetical protein